MSSVTVLTGKHRKPMRYHSKTWQSLSLVWGISGPCQDEGNPWRSNGDVSIPESLQCRTLLIPTHRPEEHIRMVRFLYIPKKE